jgi:hypothetical protein
MTTLYIFGDESGTMPKNDNDNPFVAATVAFVQAPPIAIRGSDDDKKLVGIFKRTSAIPFAAIVQPFYGYGNKLMSKYDKMRVMARVTRLLLGTNANYLDPEGINLRNIVWSHTMLQAIVHVVTETIFSTTIDSIQILLDEKTMTKATRSLFTEVLLRIGPGSKEYMESLKYLDPERVSEFMGRIQFSRKSTTIHWSGESKDYESEFGLKLAHRFARKIYRQLKDGDQTGIMSKLLDAGFNDSVIDITKIVTRPPNRRMIENWKRNTGLPEPQIL